MTPEELRKLADKLEYQEKQQKWDNTLKESIDTLKSFIGKDLLKIENQAYTVYRVKSFEEDLGTQSKFYNEAWVKNNSYLTLIGEALTCYINGQKNSPRIKKSYDGKIGIPVPCKLQYHMVYRRFIATGEINLENILFGIPSSLYKSKNSDGLISAVGRFKAYLFEAPDGMFEDVRQAYIEQLLPAIRINEKYHNLIDVNTLTKIK